ncbi:hypothetical protein [Streptomyces sp. NPDC058084]|uniref:hypothetical protein n=1 Tax=Streptomyces sp. NPDC058084 TaxID=3346333 RepID=UPI0036E1E176
MALSISIVLLLAIILFLLLRSGALRPGPTVAAVLFGFFLASSGLAPTINAALESATAAISAIKI